jgi:hypothetical protein
VIVKIAEGFKPTPRNYALIVDTSDTEMAQLTVPLHFLELISMRPPRPAPVRQSSRNPDGTEVARPAKRQPTRTPKSNDSIPISPPSETKPPEAPPAVTPPPESQ